MAALVAVIAVLIALGALWFTSEVVKRFDGQARLLLKPELVAVNADLSHANQTVRTLERRVADLERQVRFLRKAAGDPTVGEEDAFPTMVPTSALQARHFTPSQIYNA